MAALQHEVNKKQPFDLLEQEAHLNLVRTAAELEGPMLQILKPHGLTASTYNVLRILRGSGPAGRHASDIGCDMVVRVPDVTRLVDRLEQRGLVVRERSTTDRRVVVVRISDAGLELLKKLDKPVLAAHKELLGHMTTEELTALNALLVKARGGQEAE
ncbi:MAG: MarR family winged helix-turn-helix transcriptional regulator [Phycisphaerales bacterium JB065]